MKRPIVKKAIMVAAAAAITGFFYPIKQTVAPEWQITVVDEKGTRLAGIHVRETWRQFSTEQQGHEEIAQTDKDGAVHFPQRVQAASLISRGLGCWDEIRKSGKQATCGPRASVWAFGPGLGAMDAEDVQETTPKYVPREVAPDLSILPDAMVEQQTSMILLHRCPPGRFGQGCKMSDEYVPAAHQPSTTKP